MKSTATLRAGAAGRTSSALVPCLNMLDWAAISLHWKLPAVTVGKVRMEGKCAVLLHR